MRAKQVLRGLGATVLCWTIAGCGVNSGDEVAPTTTETATGRAATAGTAGTEASGGDETVGSLPPGERTDELTASTEVEPTAPPPAEPPEEWRELRDGAVLEAPAPAGLRGAPLPVDVDDVVALFDALPDELIGGVKSISARTPGDLAVDYGSPDRASPFGFAAADLPNSFLGSFLPEPRADLLVASFVVSDDDDYTVEAAGHDGDLYWVAMTGSNSGYGIDGTEWVHSMVWGRAGEPWAFMASAPTTAGRDELIAAFVAAASQIPDDVAPTPDELAADAALLTLADFGAEWLGLPHLPNDKAFGTKAVGVMADEPSCSAAIDWIEREAVELGGLLDLVTAASVAVAHSPTFVNGPTEVTHTVAVFESAQQRSSAFRATLELGWVDCVLATYDELVSATFDAASTDMAVSVDSATVRPLDVGEDGLALRFELTLQPPDGDAIRILQDVSTVGSGRAAGVVVHQIFDADNGTDARIDEIVGIATDRLVGQFGATG